MNRNILLECILGGVGACAFVVIMYMIFSINTFNHTTIVNTTTGDVDDFLTSRVPSNGQTFLIGFACGLDGLELTTISDSIHFDEDEQLQYRMGGGDLLLVSPTYVSWEAISDLALSVSVSEIGCNTGSGLDNTPLREGGTQTDGRGRDEGFGYGYGRGTRTLKRGCNSISDRFQIV
jgi:hypothetical protein